MSQAVENGDDGHGVCRITSFAAAEGLSVPLKRVDELKPGDKIRMKIGHATVVATESLDDNRTELTFYYGTKAAADNDLTVDVLNPDEWGW
ncbi:hypothetical protein KXD96_12875 [Mycobacterium sp. SMC-2]|uniref:hypothetical protein n=1 Tax=Mycobacterium sp. SMC-2 TaxID=2857058 RepID=UPI0021B4C94E|nr:hypothetical protein [Mycobacterium sp. SMC-2]UXA09624.1 hypothetical protein KXD96_12875 [Mycobacterium sp. SMC-2]